MKRKAMLLVTAAAAILAAGGWMVWRMESGLPRHVREVLQKSDSFELLTLDGSQGWFWSAEEEKSPDPAKFHHVAVLGRQRVSGPAMRDSLINALDQSVRHDNGRRAGCFNPRHGIRATVGGETIDLLICFECEGLVIFEGGRQTTLHIDDTPGPAFAEAVASLGLSTQKPEH